MSSLLIVIVLAVRALFRGGWACGSVRPVAAGAPAPSGAGHGVPDRIERAELCALPQTAAVQARRPSPAGVPPPRRQAMPVRPEGGGTPALPARRPRRTPAPPGRRTGGRPDRGVAGRRGVLARRPAGVQPALLSAPAADAAAHPIQGVAVPVYVARGALPPCLYGFPRPAVYLTPAAAGEPELLGHVLRHELTHRRHGDHIWAVLCGRRPGPPLVQSPDLAGRRSVQAGWGAGLRRGGPSRGRTTGSGPTAGL